MSRHALHSVASPEWYTPAPFIAAARELFGGAITLDPASCDEANAHVGAENFYTSGMDGLRLPWRGDVFLNPPSGSVAAFWRKLIDELRAGHIRQAIWIGYSVEQLQTLQNARAGCSPLDYPICIPSKRIAFVENESARLARLARQLEKGSSPGASLYARALAERIRAGYLPKSAPTHSNYIAYVSGDHDALGGGAGGYPGAYSDRFATIFGRFGQVVIPGAYRDRQWTRGVDSAA